jgi:hypothetical protein
MQRGVVVKLKPLITFLALLLGRAKRTFTVRVYERPNSFPKVGPPNIFLKKTSCISLYTFTKFNLYYSVLNMNQLGIYFMSVVWLEGFGITDFESMAKWWIRGKKFDSVNVIYAVVLWAIWKLRNNLCFQGQC